MFGIGSTELLVILVVALIVLGPRSLAGISRSLGKAMGEFRRVSTDFQRTLNAEAAQAEMAEREAARKEAAQSTAGESADSTTEKPAPLTEPGGVKADSAQSVAPAEATVPPQAPLAATPTAEAANADIPAPPPDSPVAQALNRSRQEAESAIARATQTGQTDTTA